MDPALLADIYKIGGLSLVLVLLVAWAGRAMWVATCRREDRMATVIDGQTTTLLKQSENCTAALTNSTRVVDENTRVTRELCQVIRERLGRAEDSTPIQPHPHITPIPRSHL